MHSINTCHPCILSMHSINTCHSCILSMHSINTCHPCILSMHSINTCNPCILSMRSINTCNPCILSMRSINTCNPCILSMHSINTYHPCILSMRSINSCHPGILAMRFINAPVRGCRGQIHFYSNQASALRVHSHKSTSSAIPSWNSNSNPFRFVCSGRVPLFDFPVSISPSNLPSRHDRRLQKLKKKLTTGGTPQINCSHPG